MFTLRCCRCAALSCEKLHVRGANQRINQLINRAAKFKFWVYRAETYIASACLPRTQAADEPSSETNCFHRRTEFRPQLELF